MLTRRLACRDATRLQGLVFRQTGAIDADGLSPTALDHYGIGFVEMRATLASANANSPKGTIERSGHACEVELATFGAVGNERARCGWRRFRAAFPATAAPMRRLWSRSRSKIVDADDRACRRPARPNLLARAAPGDD